MVAPPRKKPQMTANAATHWKDYIGAMIHALGQKRFIAVLRHPALAVLGAALFAGAAFAVIRSGMEARARLAVDDPVQISDRALERVFSRDVAQREIRSALAIGDNDLAQSFVELAADRSVAIDPALADEVKQAQVKAGSVAGTAGRFVQGLWTGEPVDGASLAGTAGGELFVFGGIRDAARRGGPPLLLRQYPRPPPRGPALPARQPRRSMDSQPRRRRHCDHRRHI